MKESAYAAGATTWEVVWNVVPPVAGGRHRRHCRLGRALGETMAVTFVIGNSDQLDTSSLYAAGNSIASALANEFTEAVSPMHTSALVELGLILFLITFIVLVFSKLLLMQLTKGEGQRT